MQIETYRNTEEAGAKNVIFEDAIFVAETKKPRTRSLPGKFTASNLLPRLLKFSPIITCPDLTRRS
jgi:hypothetical protein